MTTVSEKDFWEEKILAWEDNRYGSQAEDSSWLERVARWSSGSLRFRLAWTAQLLKDQVAGRRVVELGCGSGLLAESILEAGASHYLGVDISLGAVERGRQRVAGGPWEQRASFQQGGIADLETLNADLVFSLGLLDWLDDPMVEWVFALGGEAHYLHAIAEKSNHPYQLLHRLYVHLAYGHRTGGYVPRYYRLSQLAPMIARHHAGPLRVLRHRRLAFGALLTSLDLPGAVCFP